MTEYGDSMVNSLSCDPTRQVFNYPSHYPDIRPLNGYLDNALLICTRSAFFLLVAEFFKFKCGHDLKMKPDQVRLHAVLSDTVGILCKSALIFERKLAIQAVIGITVDENDVFLVHIDRQFGNCSINSVPPATITGNAIRQDDQLVKEIKNDRVVSFESTALDPINRQVNDINRSQLKNSGMKLKRQHTDCKLKALSKQLLRGGSGKSRKKRECNLLLSSSVGRETGISTVLSKASNKEVNNINVIV